MARANSTIPICFFKIILQTNLQTIKIPNKFTRSHGVDLPNPVMIKPPDGTKWKVFWKNINCEIWFEKGWKLFTQNYSLQHGCIVVFKYKEAPSELDAVILGQNGVEIDYDSCNIFDDENENLADSDDESVKILNERPSQKKAKQRSPSASPRPHKKVKGWIEKNSRRTTSLNIPKESRAREVAEEFISSNPFFTILIKPANLVASGLSWLNLKGIIESKEKYVTLQIGERSWKLKLLCSYNDRAKRRFSAGWTTFAKESGRQPGDVCVFELINKEDLVFKVHVF